MSENILQEIIEYPISRNSYRDILNINIPDLSTVKNVNDKLGVKTYKPIIWE